MTYKDPRLFHDVRTRKDFLVSQTDGTPNSKEPTCRQTCQNEGLTTDDQIDAVSAFFSGIPVKDQLVKDAETLIEAAETLIAMVVKLDQKPTAGTSEGLSDTKAVGGAIDALCQKEEGIWGILDTTLFGGFFPGKTQSFTEMATRQIRDYLKNISTRTVSIGIAEYPLVAFQKTQLLENACKALDHAAFFGPDSTVTFDDVSLNISGDNLFQNGDIQGAIGEFQTALLLNDTNTNVLNSLGVCYGLLGHYDDAVDAFKSATEKDPDFMTYYNLGLIYMLKETHDDALACFRKADELSEDVFEISVQTGRMYLAMEQADNAIEFLEKATQLKPTSALGFRLLGDGYNKLDRSADALTAYKQAVKLNPNDACALSAMGALYESADRNIEIASIYCEKSVELAPTEGLFHARLGKLYLRQKRLDDAAKSLRRADELGENVQDLVVEMQHLKKAG